MKFESAKTIAAIVDKAEYYQMMLKKSQSGYLDEWVLRNEHTGESIELSGENMKEIQNFFRTQFEAYRKKIEEIN